MPTTAELLSRAAGKARKVAVAASELAQQSRHPRRTSLHVPADRRSPPPSAFARYGTNSWIVPPVRVEGARGIQIGSDVALLDTAALRVAVDRGAQLTIGDRARFGKGLEITCSQRIVIGDSVSGSDNVGITDCWGSFDDDGAPTGAPVVIEDGAYLGYGCSITPGVRVGAGAYVGEGAVVVADVAAHTVVYGNPATTVRVLDGEAWVTVRSA